MNVAIRCCCGAAFEVHSNYSYNVQIAQSQFLEKHSACKPSLDVNVSNSKTLPCVLEFAQAMEGKLALNRHKGDREAWLKDDPSALVTRLYDEVNELSDAVKDKGPGEVLGEAADVANFAMMIADVCRERAAKSES